LSRKLYETFGEDAGREMVDWMQHVDVQRAELRELADLQFSRFSALLSEQITGLRHEFNVGLARLETKIEQRTADLIKWSFVFWVGAVGAIALLTGVLK
jgi:hypothetical protein